MNTSSAARQRVTYAPLLTLLIVVLPALAAAQPVKSFDQLNTRLKPGDTVYVTDAQGREVKGRIAELNPASLTLDHEAARRSFDAADVRRVRLRVDDSVLTGALIGLGTGLVAGAAILGQGDTDPTSGGIVAAALLFGGIGAAVGAGIDGLIHGKRDLYRAPGASGSARLSLAPVITPHTRGVALLYSF